MSQMLQSQNNWINEVLRVHTHILHWKELWKLWQCSQNTFFLLDAEVRQILWTASGSFDALRSLLTTQRWWWWRLLYLVSVDLSKLCFQLLCESTTEMHTRMKVKWKECSRLFKWAANKTLLRLEHYENLCSALLVIFYVKSQWVSIVLFWDFAKICRFFCCDFSPWSDVHWFENEPETNWMEKNKICHDLSTFIWSSFY